MNDSRLSEIERGAAFLHVGVKIAKTIQTIRVTSELLGKNVQHSGHKTENNRKESILVLSRQRTAVLLNINKVT
ncbi:hypothetical protein TNCV_229201 [Trichonephila clavipes]|nr:hypothetical protein TNCV_229201 [Trichonephila clavipes]